MGFRPRDSPHPPLSLSHYRRGPNETNNMLATPDDISNLNLNNLAGSALGLWDHARAFLLSSPVLSLSLSLSVPHPLSLSLSQSRHPLLLATLLSLDRTCPATLGHLHTRARELVCDLYKVVTSRRTAAGRRPSVNS